MRLTNHDTPLHGAAERVSVQQTIAARVDVLQLDDDLTDALAADMARKSIRAILFAPDASSDLDWLTLAALAQCVLETRMWARR